jgi:hypothetical protein
LRVLARIEILTEAEAGHEIVRRGAYRPTHQLDPDEAASFYIGEVELGEGEELRSGDCKDRVVNFISDDLVRPFLKPGRQWQFREGPTLVARATVLEILE